MLANKTDDGSLTLKTDSQGNLEAANKTNNDKPLSAEVEEVLRSQGDNTEIGDIKTPKKKDTVESGDRKQPKKADAADAADANVSMHHSEKYLEDVKGDGEAAKSANQTADDKRAKAKGALADDAFDVGRRIVIANRSGAIIWNGRPQHRFIKVRWDDTMEKSGVLSMDQVSQVQSTTDLSISPFLLPP